MTNTAGDMPLHLAARYDVAGAATRFLMQCGEETIERPNHAGVTPFAVAQQRGSSEVLYIFANWRIILRQRTIARMTGEITETGRATMNPSHAAAVKERVAQIVGAQAQSTGAVEDDTGGVAAGEMVFAGLSKIDERSLPADALIQVCHPLSPARARFFCVTLRLCPHFCSPAYTLRLLWVPSCFLCMHARPAALAFAGRLVVPKACARGRDSRQAISARDAAVG
ncbi:hypothetical protein EON66_02675 [archaeon]|nr:MAG: hypothetical protein EON66_02675 [archaeon]